jgi:4-hydroxybenzoate polyprenyltransferase
VKLETAAKLGRVSNLPTVWTNVLAGVVLAGGDPGFVPLVSLLVAMSAFYVGGMFLNDFHDRHIDALERPERPIPSGEVGAEEVGRHGGRLLAWGVVLVAAVSALAGGGLWPVLTATGLAGCIVAYDRHHKRNRLSPVLMGLCRVAVYLTAGLCFTRHPDPMLWVGAVGLFAYLIGLTYAAKSENLARLANTWPLALLALPFVFGFFELGGFDFAFFIYLGFGTWVFRALRFLLPKRGRPLIPKAVVSLIAGISLLDAFSIAAMGRPGLALLALLGFGATLLLQRRIAGT